MAKVRVDQKDGEIVVHHRRPELLTYKVSEGTVDVDDADLGWFLQYVGGSVADASNADAGTPGDDSSDAGPKTGRRS